VSSDVESARRELRELDRKLRELVAAAASRGSDLAPLWEDCETIGRGIADIALAARHAAPEDKKLLVEEMTVLGEFYAIATDYLQREQAAVETLLQQVRQSRETLAYYGSKQEPGESCDVTG
jgi:hypothetical protein